MMKDFMAAVGGRETDVGLSKRIFTAWDLSRFDGTNDRMAKIGYGDGSFFGAAYMETETRAMKLLDGLYFASGVTTRRPIEPDNLVLRLHQIGGKGLDNVWAVRLIVDHENDAASRIHRSTMLINQSGNQCWSWLSDALWIGDLGATNKHRELDIDGGGVTKMIYANSRGGFRAGRTGGKEGKPRAATAINAARNAGFYTDGDKAASLWHIFWAMPLGGGGGVPGEMELPPGMTVAEPFLKGGPGSTQAGDGAGGSAGGDGCKKFEKWMGALRGDVNFDMDGKAVHLAVDVAYETGGDRYAGNHWIHSPLPKPPQYEPAKDGKSNQPILDRQLRRGLWVWVKVHRDIEENPNEPPPQLSPSGAGATGIAGLGPDAAAAGSGGASGPDTGDWTTPNFIYDCAQAKLVFGPSKVTFETGRVSTPEYSDNLKCRIVVPYTLPVLLAAGEVMEFRLFYKIQQTAGDECPDEWDEIVTEISEATQPDTVDTVNWLTFTLPTLDYKTSRACGGGNVWYYFMRRSDDGVNKDFYMVGNIHHSFYPTRSKNPLFTGVVDAS